MRAPQPFLIIPKIVVAGSRDRFVPCIGSDPPQSFDSLTGEFHDRGRQSDRALCPINLVNESESRACNGVVTLLRIAIYGVWTVVNLVRFVYL